MQVVVTTVATTDKLLAVFKARKEYDNKPAFLMDVFHTFGNITEPDIVGIYKLIVVCHMTTLLLSC